MLALYTRMLFSISGCALALLVAVPAQAGGRIYTWTNDDGVVAFTDDAKSIPAMYRAAATTRPRAGLDGYRRYTPTDSSVATSDYARRLSARLTHLRTFTAQTPTAHAAKSQERGVGQTIALRTGGENSPIVELTSGGDASGPIIVEKLRGRPADKLVTRNNTVVRRGDETLAIVRSLGREWNVAEDIHIEDTLE